MTVYVSLDSYAVAMTTGLAVGVHKISGLRRNDDLIWIPRSVIEHGDDVDIGETDLSVQEWFAIREGLNT